MLKPHFISISRVILQNRAWNPWKCQLWPRGTHILRWKIYLLLLMEKPIYTIYCHEYLEWIILWVPESVIVRICNVSPKGWYHGVPPSFNLKFILKTQFYNTVWTLLTKRHVPLMYFPTLNIYPGQTCTCRSDYYIIINYYFVVEHLSRVQSVVGLNPTWGNSHFHFSIASGVFLSFFLSFYISDNIMYVPLSTMESFYSGKPDI